MYLDGVYLARPAMVFERFLDLDASKCFVDRRARCMDATRSAGR
jgi:hypothetical protein